MMDSFFEIGISNALFSLALAVIAVVVGRFTNRPHLAHLLWLLVLAKLLMPAVIPVTYYFEPGAPTNTNLALVPIIESSPAVVDAITESQIGDKTSSIFSEILLVAKGVGLNYLPIIWCAGILIALFWSLYRVVKFHRLLRSSSENADASIYKMAEELASELSLKKLPLINVTNAGVAPMVWWIGQRVEIFIPISLIQTMEPAQLRFVLAHELAHVKRRDFMVRWIEWSAAVLFWWNPVVWWAQRNLRANEEICCDALVMYALKPEPQDYAASLLNAVENFSAPAFRPPAMASEINSGGYLIRRINMILSSNNKQKLKRKMQITVLAVAALVLPLGITFAQEKETEPELKKRVEQIEKDIKQGKISKKDAKIELDEVKKKLEIQAAIRKLNAGVKSRKLTAEEAAKKREAIERHQRKKSQASDQLKERMKEIETARKAGKLTNEDAEKSVRKLKLHFEMKQHERKLFLANKKLRSAVKAGRISESDALAKLVELKKGLGEIRLNTNRRLAAEKLKLAVGAGKISKIEAERQLIELQRSLKTSNRSFDINSAFGQLKLAEAESNSRAKKAAQNLQSELKAGKISKEEAERQLIELKRRHESEQQMFYFKRAREKLEAAVKSGKMSEGDAKAKMLELERKMKKDN